MSRQLHFHTSLMPPFMQLLFSIAQSRQYQRKLEVSTIDICLMTPMCLVLISRRTYYASMTCHRFIRTANTHIIITVPELLPLSTMQAFTEGLPASHARRITTIYGLHIMIECRHIIVNPEEPSFIFSNYFHIGEYLQGRHY